jgi:class 3 adenylate cyclase/tetratricopeptide (TPR) repeat protein
LPDCPQCGYECPERSRFCPSCAAPLAPDIPKAAERKVVTTLFCDLVGFTAMSEAADPEDVDALLRAYGAAVRKVVEIHGGTVEKYVGDAVLAVFGVPHAHEDDPERAVRAGLRVVQAVDAMARPDGTPLRVRVGVNTGEALVHLGVEPGSGQGILVGDAVNTASRLQHAAPPMGVVVGGPTHALTEDVFEYEPLASLAPKGSTAPVAVWLAKAPRSRMGVRGLGSSLTPMVGRDGEAAYLDSLCEKALGTLSPQCVLVLGDPGIGKSRLVADLFERVDARAELIRWRQGRCLPYGEGRTFWALGEIVKAHAGIRETDDAGTAAEKLERVVPEGPGRDWICARLRPLVGLEAPHVEREENFAAWLAFFEGLAAALPLVLVVEDLHWAEDALLAFFEYVSVHAGASPLMVVGTARPEMFETGGSFAASAGRIARVWLDRLSDGETERLIAALPEAAALDRRVLDAIVRRAEGNPFYAEELARLWSDTALRDDLLGPAAAASLPLSVQAVIASRIDALSAKGKACLADAAVVGQSFWSGAIVALERGDEAIVEEALRELLTRRLVRHVPDSSVENEDEYAFCHWIVRDVIYRQLPRDVRAAKHAAVARWTEAKAGDRADGQAQVLAWHYAAAVELARAAGDHPLADELVTPAVRYLSISGGRAVQLDASEAHRHYSRALGIAGPDDAGRPALLARSAELLFQGARYREAAATLAEAARAFLATGDRRAAALALARLADVLYALGDPGVTERLEEAFGLLDHEEPSPELATVLGSWGKALWLAGDPHAGLAMIEQSLRISRDLELPEPVLLRGYRGGIRCILGDVDGLDDYVRALEAARGPDLKREAALLVFNYADALLSYKGPGAAAAVLRDGLDSVRRRRLEEFAVWAPVAALEPVTLTSEWDAEAGRRLGVNLVEALGLVGRWDQALAMAEEMIPDLEHNESRVGLVIVRTQVAVLRVGRGEAGLARPFADWLEQTGMASEIPWITAYALLAAAVRLQLGEAERALHVLAEWAGRPRPGSGPNYVAYLPEAVRTALTVGDAGLAARLVEGVEALLPIQRHALATTHGLLAERRGEHEAAAESYAAAASGWREFEVPYEEAHARLGLGRSLAAMGDERQAAGPAAEAHEIFARLGARPAVAESQELLARLAASRAS